jgi:DNA repair protein RecN (Recombination protein N)
VGSKKQIKSSLEEISIRGLGVIESSNIEFKPGLTVLTGETGAGKTMVLTALGLVLGSKSDSDLIRQGAERAVVTGKFAVPKEVAEEVLELGGEIDDNSVVITRTISTAGKSRVLVGGAVSSTSAVNTFSSSLVEIHAQSSSSKLTKPGVARELLDRFAAIDIGKYQQLFQSYNLVKNRIDDLKSQLKQSDTQIEELKAFIDEFNKISPKPNELDEIENEIAKLGSVEQLNQSVTQALNLLENDELSAINLLQQIRKNLDSVRGKDGQLDQISDRFTENLLNISDVNSDLASYLVDLEADPNRFEKLQERKAGLNALLRKYGKGSDRQIAYDQLLVDGSKAKDRIEDLSGGQVRVDELEKEAGEIFASLKNEALKLSEKRASAAKQLSDEVTDEVRNLSMPNATFQISHQLSSADTASNYTQFGIDEITLLFSAHAGGTPLPLNKVASGGELSRVMLALEVVIAEAEPIGTYIFDEVDAGVGGKAAVEIGRRLAKLSKSAQVIVITHLAQVAVWADNHLVVKKNEDGLVTQSDVLEVTEQDRKVEIARMLSGQEDSQTAQEHAGELLAIVRNA